TCWCRLARMPTALLRRLLPFSRRQIRRWLSTAPSRRSGGDAGSALPHPPPRSTVTRNSVTLRFSPSLPVDRSGSIGTAARERRTYQPSAPRACGRPGPAHSDAASLGEVVSRTACPFDVGMPLHPLWLDAPLHPLSASMVDAMPPGLCRPSHLFDQTN